MVKDNNWLSFIPKMVWYAFSISIIAIASGFAYKTISSQSCSFEVPNKFKVVMNQTMSSMTNATSTVIAVNEELLRGIERQYKQMNDLVHQQNSEGESEGKPKSDKSGLLPKTDTDMWFVKNLKMSKDKMQESILQMKEAQKALEKLKF